MLERDRGCCAVCGEQVQGTRGIDWSVQHRMARKRGGSRRPWINLPGNLILLCGNGVEGCHFKVESEVWWACSQGFKVREGRWMPVEHHVVHAVHGEVWLDDEGGISYSPPAREDSA